ncbi:MAG: hypothetical protein AAFO79_01690 [Pseudomonadota bacterium]
MQIALFNDAGEVIGVLAGLPEHDPAATATTGAAVSYTVTAPATPHASARSYPASQSVVPGMRLDDAGVLVSPVVADPVPQTVTMFQARAALMGLPSRNPDAPAGRTMFDDANDLIAALGPSSLEFQAWEYGQEVTRGGNLVNSMAAQLSLSEADLDALFSAAAQIEA